MENVVIENYQAMEGFWLIGWLFTIGYLRLSFWKGFIGLIVWPYYLGAHFTKRPKKKKK